MPVLVPRSEQEALADTKAIDDIINIAADDTDAAGAFNAVEESLLMFRQHTAGGFDFNADELARSVFIKVEVARSRRYQGNRELTPCLASLSSGICPAHSALV